MDSLSNIFTSLCDNLQMVIDKLQEGTSGRESSSFVLSDFWTRIDVSVKQLAAQCTNMSLMFSKLPVPNQKDCQSIIEKFEMVTLTMVSIYYSLPKSQGNTLHTCVTSNILSIVKACKKFVLIIKNSDGQGSPEQLHSTGNVWECCDSMASLPRDNREAVIQNTRAVQSLVEDAVNELSEAQSTQDQEDYEGMSADEIEQNTWTESDRQLLAPSMGLLKVAKSCVKKSLGALKRNADCGNGQNIAQLDDVDKMLQKSSPAVDDLAFVLYPPMDKSAVREHAKTLFDHIREVLKLIRDTHITGEDDQEWVEFLLKASNHNMSKIESLTT